MIQLLPPVLALLALLVLVAGLDAGVTGALAGWALANALTAVFALVATCDLWLPAKLPRLLDGAGRTLLRLAFVMGAVQVVNLISYRAELFVLGAHEPLQGAHGHGYRGGATAARVPATPRITDQAGHARVADRPLRGQRGEHRTAWADG